MWKPIRKTYINQLVFPDMRKRGMFLMAQMTIHWSTFLLRIIDVETYGWPTIRLYKWIRYKWLVSHVDVSLQNGM